MRGLRKTFFSISSDLMYLTVKLSPSLDLYAIYETQYENGN